GHHDDVRHDIPMLAAEHFAGATETRDYLVVDEQDLVAFAHLADEWPVFVRWNDDPATADDWLADECRYCLRTFELDDLLQFIGQPVRGLTRSHAAEQAVGVGRTDVEEAGRQRLDAHLAHVLPSGAESRHRPAVIAPVAGDDFESIFRGVFLPRILAGHLEGELSRFRATVHELNVIEIAWEHVRELSSELERDG